MKERRPVKLNSPTSIYRIKVALYTILGCLSTQDLKYLLELKNNNWTLDFVGVVIDEIVQARQLKQDDIYDELTDEINL